jgi:hypothetical protein
VTIQITRPETQALIKRRLDTGSFKDAEDVVLQALKLSEPNGIGVTKSAGKLLIG